MQYFTELLLIAHPDNDYVMNWVLFIGYDFLHLGPIIIIVKESVKICHLTACCTPWAHRRKLILYCKLEISLLFF